MDALANISCCFDASKDIGETSVELVICNIPATKSCCLKWETFTYVAALVFSGTDFIADTFGYVTFANAVVNKEPIQVYLDAWLAFLIISGFIIISEISLPIFSLVKITGCCPETERPEEEVDKYRQITKYWSRANNILVILTEDGVIAVVKILIAFKSVEAVKDLQTTSGAVTSGIAFTVTILRHCLLIMQIVTKLSRNNVTLSKCPAWPQGYCVKATFGMYILFFTTLFLSCCSLALTGMSMAIALNIFEIHNNDSTDFLLNITLISVIVPSVMVLSVFLIVQTRW